MNSNSKKDPPLDIPYTYAYDKEFISPFSHILGFNYNKIKN